MKNTTWNRILPGDIVTFIYKSEDQSRGRKRWVICLDPKYTYRKQNGTIVRFFVGIQIDQQGKRRLPQPVIKEVVSLLGGVAKKQSGGSQINIEGVSEDAVPREISPGEFKKKYRILKRIFKRNSIFRTYDLRECKKRRVYLEEKYDFIPKETIKQFITEINIGDEVVIED
jgi:hypothetical protein|tara:strand:- start:1992 stop:2504 length:513 start_codon:yes stop_codon:yes gene_type:complete